MKPTATHKQVVTSGRLTSGVSTQKTKKKMTPPARPEPSYSLYSTDAEDQVTSLHKGLDRCAALLGDILQADNGASPSPSRPAICRTAKSRPSLGKKSLKKLPKKTVQKNPQSSQRGAASTTQKKTQSFTSPAPHTGVKLHPPKKPTPIKASASPSIPSPQPQTSVLLSVFQSSAQLFQTPSGHTKRQTTPQQSRRHCNVGCNEEEEESVPVKDTNTQCTAINSQSLIKNKPPHVLDCTAKLSNVHLESARDDEMDADGCTEREVKEKTTEYLLGQLKVLIAGQGSVAERLLSHLEEVVSSPLPNDHPDVHSESVPDLLSLQNQNLQLRRQVRILKQQLMEQGKGENLETMSHSEVKTVWDELTTTQSQLQELQRDLTQLRGALQDTRSELHSRETENAVIGTDLETTQMRLLDTERQKSEFASLAQQRLEELEILKRMLQSQKSADCPSKVDVLDSPTPHQPPTERITEYLRSLTRLGPSRSSAEDQRGADRRPVDAEAPSQLQELPLSARPLDSTLSQCDTESEWSSWSTRSESTFNTKDEAAFKDGLAALDASIDSLWKTLQLDLGR